MRQLLIVALLSAALFAMTAFIAKGQTRHFLAGPKEFILVCTIDADKTVLRCRLKEHK